MRLFLYKTQIAHLKFIYGQSIKIATNSCEDNVRCIEYSRREYSCEQPSKREAIVKIEKTNKKKIFVKEKRKNGKYTYICHILIRISNRNEIKTK